MDFLAANHACIVGLCGQNKAHLCDSAAFLFTVRCYAITQYMLSLCVCLSVHLTQVVVLLKWLNVGSYKQRHTIAQEI